MTNNVTRRTAVAGLLVGGLLLAAVPAKADWHDQYKELNFGISSAENERDAVARYDKFSAYMTKKLGVPVHILWGTDYAAVIEALHSNKIQFATIGAANYALGRKVMGDKITAVATSEDNYGSTGYHSVIVVKTDSPYQKIDDLKGKVLAWADPNSTSGYAVPLYFMKKDGIDPSTFFSKTPFSGSHELGVVGVVNGTFDAAADDWTNPQKSNALRMEGKGMVPKGSTRVIWTSNLIPNGPYVMRSDLPQDLQDAYRNAILSYPKEDPTDFKAQTDGTSKDLVPVKDSDYDDIIAITQANDAERRKH
ncbi:phosphonate ABC transporter substrate-binding protein [Rhizobium mayense]|uniref:Phosphonate ABC transporter substrate-binding protein n=1 Tax=Rhizobium mayense TaxID=1312184 RepID=A0ABT7JVZ8_9HYPH|nr:phosphonate ABC transporter substrate-binding protein [Rhizobium mayense]MDL2400082.1 phosphonate ABC transporter substrate-binding protein [Rhizobium mayense]